MDLRFTLTSCCLEPDRRNRVLSVFNFKRLANIQQFISSTHVANIEVPIANIEVSIANIDVSIANIEVSITNIEVSIANIEVSIANIEVSIANIEVSIAVCHQHTSVHIIYDRLNLFLGRRKVSKLY